MQLTGKQIIERGIVTNYCPEGLQQQGIDVRIDKIFKLTGTGIIRKVGKTQLPSTSPILDLGYWDLEPGYYEVELMEGIKMPNNAALQFKTRSSLVRSGVIVHSGQFDAGFETEHAGCFIEVIRPTRIEREARIAQAIVFQSDAVDNTYEGQFQNDKQRNG